MWQRGLRRVWIGLCVVASTVFAHEGVEVGKESALVQWVPAEQVENSAATQYAQLIKDAAAHNALGSDEHPQVVRVRRIAQALIPFAYEWNPRARNWRWEVNVIGSKQINAFCMPGGKIVFYSAILKDLELTDDEVAMVMGHEIAHALREHARERMAKSTITNGVATVGSIAASVFFGINPNVTDFVAKNGANLLTLKFSREDESEADLVGMELAARAGFDPRSGVRLWQKMAQANQGTPPQFLSTHPSSSTRIQEIEANLPKVMPLYEQALAQREPIR